MPENPLLPNAQLRALHALLVQTLEHEKALRGRGAARRSAAPPPLARREALLAGTLLQLGAGDVLVAEPGDAVPSAIVRSQATKANVPASTLDLAPGSPQLALATALAGSLQQAGSDRVVLLFVRAGLAETDWAKTLAHVEGAKLPLILACADPSGANAFRPTSEPAPNAAYSKTAPLTWSTVQKTASRLKLPVLSVDGEDAVAVYRVMQESVLRARSGGGPAILWAMLPDGTESIGKQPKAALPLRRLEHYLKTRNIPL